MLKKELYPTHTSIRKLPKNSNTSNLHIFNHERKKVIPAVEITYFNNIRVLGNILFDSHSKSFLSAYTHIDKITIKRKIETLYSFLKKPIKISKALWFIDDWSTGYFHWFTDALPRFIALKEYRETHKILLPQKFKSFPYIIDSLKELNISPYFFEENEPLLIKELITTNQIATTGNYHKGLMLQLSQLFQKKKIKPPPHRAIYLSRKKASRRKITNEEACITVLENMGVETHLFEDYSFAKQLSIIKETKLLIGVHGAGLTNMLFMPKNSSIFELRNNQDQHNQCYFTLASDLEHDYYYFGADPTSDDKHNADITLNLPLFKTELKAIL